MILEGDYLHKNKNENACFTVIEYFPPKCKQIMLESIARDGRSASTLSEVRVRCGRYVVLCFGRKKLICEYIVTKFDIQCILREICSGSVYAYQNNIREGYIPLAHGGRAGVVGDVVDTSLDIAIESITAINIRVPHHIRGVCAKLYDLFMSEKKGILVYSYPGVGKTSLLRDLAIELSRGKHALNVALIDSRRELDDGELPVDCMIDVYSGYVKKVGIEIACRTMSSEVIICDEIGPDEVLAIKNTILCSVPVIAAAHARDRNELSHRKDLKELLEIGAFGYVVGLYRKKDFGFDFVIDKVIC